MQHHEFSFWKETYELCAEIVSIAGRCEKSGEPLYRLLASAVEDVPFSIISAGRSDNLKELQAMLMRVFTDLQTACWVLFALSMRGALEEMIVCEILRRSAGVQCDMLAFYREQCV